MSKQLPISDFKDKIAELLKCNDVIVVAGETGSGKTTQLPQYCLEILNPKGKICITQPRRLAAVSMAQRVSEELNSTLGDKCGYKVRFYNKESINTRILFLTDGVLVNEIQRDRYLKKYDIIIIDEAHERNLNIDFLIGYLRKLRKKRSNLKIIISSATIDTELFSKAFNNAPVITVPGRLFSVDILYYPIENTELSYIEVACNMVETIVDDDKGDVLIFMPTEKDISETISILNERFSEKIEALPLYSRLTRFQQHRVFAKYSRRKVIVSTNIAETSITVEGITYVIDTGFERIKEYSPQIRTNRLPIKRISKSSAEQRKGRAGRVAPGICIRLYSEEEFINFEEFTKPEIKRSNLTSVILTMQTLKIGNISTFPFLEPPDKKSITDAVRQLKELGALNQKGFITSKGRKMGRIPIEPHISAMILAAKKYNVLFDTIRIASGLSIPDPRRRPAEEVGKANIKHRNFISKGSDFFTLLNIRNKCEEIEKKFSRNALRKFCKSNFLSFETINEWSDIESQISHIVKEFGFPSVRQKSFNENAIYKSILSGLLSNIACKNEKGFGYTAVRGKEVFVFPGSVLFKNKPDWIMANEITETSKLYARIVAPINPKWLEEVAPHLIKKSYGEPYYDESSGYVSVREDVRYYNLKLFSRTVNYKKIDPKKASEIFINEALVELRLNQKFKFMEKNERLISDLKNEENKLRTDSEFVSFDKLFDFYMKRLNNVSSIDDLTKVIREKGSDKFLIVNKEDLLISELPEEVNLYPNTLNVADKDFQLSYEFNPGSDNDGVTVNIPLNDISVMGENSTDWIVPTLWKEKSLALLKSLPKSKRKLFVPMPDTVNWIVKKLKNEGKSFTETLVDIIRKEKGIILKKEDFNEDKIPDHLKVRITVLNSKGKEIASGRKLNDVKNKLYKKQTKHSKKLIGKQEIFITKKPIDSFPNMDKQVLISPKESDIPVFGYSALLYEDKKFFLVVEAEQEKALSDHSYGIKTMLQRDLDKELLFLKKDMKFSKEAKLCITPFFTEEILTKSIIAIIKRDVFSFNNLPYDKTEYNELKETIKKNLGGIGFKTTELLSVFFKIMNQNFSLIKSESFKRKELDKSKIIKPLNYLLDNMQMYKITYDELMQYDRYAKAYSYRINIFYNNPKNYRLKTEEAHELIEAVKKIRSKMTELNGLTKEEALFILYVNEYIISLFAQNMGTIFPVSRKRCMKLLKKINRNE